MCFDETENGGSPVQCRRNWWVFDDPVSVLAKVPSPCLVHMFRNLRLGEPMDGMLVISSLKLTLYSFLRAAYRERNCSMARALTVFINVLAATMRLVSAASPLRQVSMRPEVR